jgi:hypothetical protein
MATSVQTTETLRTTEKTEFLKLFSVPSAVLSVSVVKIRSLVINALQLEFLGSSFSRSLSLVRMPCLPEKRTGNVAG